ncbi:hypothetical protein [Runella sp.]|jgi:hypothetical protein|uniref:hypothetical protein n=1 Tax=Runella sp. TaxID=1960881 RepID=UPI0026393251|nr:hypothetical protein [Runella sp.]
MATMKIILTDDLGVGINTRSYDLGKSLKKLGEMEGKIEELRPQILGDLTNDLLSSAQNNDKKKGYAAIKK